MSKIILISIILSIFSFTITQKDHLALEKVHNSFVSTLQDLMQDKNRVQAVSAVMDLCDPDIICIEDKPQEYLLTTYETPSQVKSYFETFAQEISPSCMTSYQTTINFPFTAIDYEAKSTRTASSAKGRIIIHWCNNKIVRIAHTR